MPDADLATLTLKMRRLQRWSEDEGAPRPTTVVHYAGHPSARVTIDPTSRSPAASFNHNRITLWGGRDLSDSDLDDMARLFEASGIERFFVWLHPGPGLARVHAWLATAGATKVPWTRYPTLVYSGASPGRRAATAVDVRKITRREIDAAALTEEDVPGGYLETIGRPGFHHFAAFDAGRLIATAGLSHFEDVAFLNGARTLEAFRRRGAQTALIAARIDEAQRLGCTLIATETLTMLPSSFANLLRAGFEVAYEREVYECVKHPTPSTGL
jgi:GNAT superfamily N-acetyltransferase